MKPIKLSKVFLAEHPNMANGQNYRSGRGAGAPAYFPFSHVHGRPPHPWPQHGWSGDPDSAPSVTANRLLQNTMTQDDVEYWAGDPEDPNDNGASFDAPFTQGLDDFGNLKYASMGGRAGSPQESVLRSYIQDILHET